MERRLIIIMIVLGALGWVGLKMIEWQLGLGDFARSPQRVARDQAQGGRGEREDL